jgi:tRNA(fMet)-specific endonuclease VapC
MQRLQQHADTLALAAPVWHEMLFGWQRMPQGQRRERIGSYLHGVLASLPLLAYDGAAARVHAHIRAARERLGQPLPFADGQIAAIAIAQGLTLVTRNLADFAHIEDLQLVNWHEVG